MLSAAAQLRRVRQVIMLSRETTRTFLRTWFSFAWFFVSIAVMNDDLQRSFTNWLIRGVIGGFFVGAISAYLDQRRRAKELSQEAPSEQVKPTATPGNLAE